MIWLTTKAWPWLKKYWKWIIFPVGIIGLIFGAIATAQAISNYAEPPEDLNEETRKALKDLRTADETRDRQIAELEVKHKKRLQEMTEEQHVQLKELRGKDLDEVVSWFNGL